MASITNNLKRDGGTRLVKPKILISNETGVEILFAPEEKYPAFILRPTGLKICVRDKEIVRVTNSANLGLLHGVDKPITAFTNDGNVLAIFDNGELSFFNLSTNEALVTNNNSSLGRVELMSFSPLGTFFVTWSRVYKGDKDANLVIYRVNNGVCCNVVAKYFERRQPEWPAIRFTRSESLASRMKKDEIQIFENCNFAENCTRIKLPGVNKYSMFSTMDGLETKFALFKPENRGGGPARVNIYESNSLSSVKASKTFYKSQNIEFHWSPNGKVLLLQTHTDISNNTYYGESNLYMLHTDGTYDCTINRTKSGPLHAVAWSPKGNEFTVIAGNFPANITVYNPKTGSPYFELGAAARNVLCYSPHGRFLCVAGFGSLRGDIDFWDMNKRKLMGSANGSCSITYSWSPCGRWFVTGSTYPRMQVDNFYQIFKYNGEGPVCKVLSKRLFDVSWAPALKGTFPDRPQEKKRTKNKNSLDVAAGSLGAHYLGDEKQGNKPAYCPPGARTRGVLSNGGRGRSLADMLGETDAGAGKVKKVVSTISFNGNGRIIPGMTAQKAKEGKRKRKKRIKEKVHEGSIKRPDNGKIDKQPVLDGTDNSVHPSEMTLNMLAKNIKKLQKKLKQIALLKMRRDEQQEILNSDQNKKISNEGDILRLLNEMKIVTATKSKRL
jgi:translation initiation factor 2A